MLQRFLSTSVIYELWHFPRLCIPRYEPFMNKMWVKWWLKFFSINFSDTFRSTGLRQGARKMFIFTDIFSWKMTFWMRILPLLHKQIYINAALNFVIAMDFFEVSSWGKFTLDGIFAQRETISELCRSDLQSDFSMFNQIFFLAQVRRWAIITYKHRIYELPYELPNHLRLRILGN